MCFLMYLSPKCFQEHWTTVCSVCVSTCIWERVLGNRWLEVVSKWLLDNTVVNDLGLQIIPNIEPNKCENDSVTASYKPRRWKCSNTKLIRFGPKSPVLGAGLKFWVKEAVAKTHAEWTRHNTRAAKWSPGDSASSSRWATGLNVRPEIGRN